MWYTPNRIDQYGYAKGRVKPMQPRRQNRERWVNCTVCDQQFKTNGPTAKYCSKDCHTIGTNARRRARDAVQRERTRAHEAKCANCGVKFKAFRHDQISCTRSCKEELASKKLTEEAKARVKVCKGCGTDFKPYYSPRKKYCGDECYRQYYNRTKKDQYHAKKQRGVS